MRLSSFAKTLLVLCAIMLTLGSWSCGGSTGEDGDSNTGQQTSLDCGDSETVCSGQCVNLDVSDDHCGQCGQNCTPNEVCNAGTCELSCPSGLTKCNGECVDTDVDPANCGSCGSSCMQAQLCDQGTCTYQCQSGLEKCGQSCIDTTSNLSHCGSCGNSCDSAPKNARAICQESGCDWTCRDGFRDCNADSQDGCELAVRTITGTGDAIATGTTDCSESNNYTGSCATGGPEIAYYWTAPDTRQYTIDTANSEYDTALHVRESDCTGSELACNDDAQGLDLQSRVTISATQGTQYVIFVDAYAEGDCGNYELNINPDTTN